MTDVDINLDIYRNIGADINIDIAINMDIDVNSPQSAVTEKIDRDTLPIFSAIE